MTLDQIRAAVASGSWALTRHARERAGKRYISDESLVHILAQGEILEDYPDDPRSPSSLVLGEDEGGDGRSTPSVPWIRPGRSW